MKSVKKDIEKSITKAKKYDKAQEVALQIMELTKPSLQHDKIWEEWQHLLLSALILHCALTKGKESPLYRLDGLLSDEVGGAKAISEALAKPVEKEALKIFEASLELTPAAKVTDKTMSVRANRWSGTISGLANRIARLRDADSNSD